MKFLVDAQLPQSLSNWLNNKGFDSLHAAELVNGTKSTDSQIIQIAIEEERIILTKDSDFFEYYLIKNQPKKLMMITAGNISNRKLFSLLDKNFQMVLELISANHVIELSNTQIIVHF